MKKGSNAKVTCKGRRSHGSASQQGPSQGEGSLVDAGTSTDTKVRAKKSKKGDDPGEGSMYTVTDKGFQCLHCRHATKRKSDIKKHFRTHSKDKPYKCEECDKSFSDPSTRSRHMRGHSGRIKFFVRTHVIISQLIDRKLDSSEMPTSKGLVYTGQNSCTVAKNT